MNVVRDQLERVFVALDGELDDQATKSMTPLPGDFLHVDSGTFIEIDEHQHFTSSRALTLRMYPETASLGFDCTDYVRLCETWAPRSDRYRRDKAARGFGAGGRQRQRAYHDALRDLATPAMGSPAVVRVPACDRDGAAYARVREQLSALR